jgi:DNA-binding NtrC family response regulator
MLTAFETVDTAVEAMKAGAYDYLTKPVHSDEMLVVVRRALDHNSSRGTGAFLAPQPQPEVRF